MYSLCKNSLSNVHVTFCDQIECYNIHWRVKVLEIFLGLKITEITYPANQTNMYFAQIPTEHTYIFRQPNVRSYIIGIDSIMSSNYYIKSNQTK